MSLNELPTIELQYGSGLGGAANSSDPPPSASIVANAASFGTSSLGSREISSAPNPQPGQNLDVPRGPRLNPSPPRSSPRSFRQWFSSRDKE